MLSQGWYQHNNMAIKLRDALDAVINGQGLPYVFKGLDSGKCTVEVTYNGEVCVFCAKNPTLFDAKIPKPAEPVSVAEAMDPADLDEDPTVVKVEAKIRGRKPKALVAQAVPVGEGVKAEF